MAQSQTYTDDDSGPAEPAHRRHPDGGRPSMQGLLVGGAIEVWESFTLDDVADAVRAARRGSRFVWVRLIEPDEDTLRQAREVLGIHPSAFADVLSGRQQPKVQKLDEHLFVMLWNVMQSPDDALVLGETFLYIGEGWLLTVQRGTEAAPPDLRRILEEAPEGSLSDTLPAAYAIMAKIIDGYAKAAAEIESALEQLEEQVFDEDSREDHRRIYRVRKEIGRVDRAVSSIAAALHESTRHMETSKMGREQIAPHLHNLLDDAAGTAALINNQSKSLDAILSSHENNIAARQNQDMRTISAFAALLAVPTLVAGLYGMNFKNIPLVQWQYGWLAVAIAIVVADVVIFFMFKRRHWL